MALKDITLGFYDDSFTLLAVVDDILSLTWIRRLRALGEFELDIPYTSGMEDWLTLGLYVIRDDVDQVYIIDSVQYTRDAEDGIYVHLHGKDVICLLGQRVLADKMVNKIPVSIITAIHRMLYKTCNNHNGSLDAHPQRSLDTILTFRNAGIPVTEILYNICGVNLLEQLYVLAQTYNFGIVAAYTPDDGTTPVTVTFRPFNDRRENLIFSDGMGNLTAWHYEEANDEERANVSYVRKNDQMEYIVVNDTQYSGKDRFEVYSDAGLSDTDDEGNPLTPAEYAASLDGYGRTILHQTTHAISAEGNDMVYHYPGDYDIGDIATVEFGVTTGIYAIISEITEIYDSTGVSIFPSFEELEAVRELATETGNIITTEAGNIIVTEGL